MDTETKRKIREAYQQGTLRVQSVNTETGELTRERVESVLRHQTPHKVLVRVTTEDSRSVTCTEDHSLFEMTDENGEGTLRPLEGCRVVAGRTRLVVCDRGSPQGVPVASVIVMPPHSHTYDLSVPGPENFVLTNGILAHNSYSIGGISLDLEKSSKYDSLRSAAEQQFDKAAEAKARTVKFLRGLSQPRFGTGVRSSFGPHTGRGVLSPRNFLAVFLLFSVSYLYDHMPLVQSFLQLPHLSA